jgi:hypothetical protein
MGTGSQMRPSPATSSALRRRRGTGSYSATVRRRRHQEHVAPRLHAAAAPHPPPRRVERAQPSSPSSAPTPVPCSRRGTEASWRRCGGGTTGAAGRRAAAADVVVMSAWLSSQERHVRAGTARRGSAVWVPPGWREAARTGSPAGWGPTAWSAPVRPSERPAAPARGFGAAGRRRRAGARGRLLLQ